MRATLVLLIVVMISSVMFTISAEAQLKIRISVKMFYDNSHEPPIPPGGDVNPKDKIIDQDHCGNVYDNSAISCDQEIFEKIDYCNTVLARLGRGYQFELVEIIHLTDPPEPPAHIADETNTWTWADHGRFGQNALDSAVTAKPMTYAWRDDALNFYVFNGGGGYSDALSNNSDNRAIMTSQGTRGSWIRFLHEGFHLLGLVHTFRNPCPDVCDGMCDTIIDTQLSGTHDDVAVFAFGDSLKYLSCEQQEQVFDSYFNIMSYHADDGHCDDCRLSDPELIQCGFIPQRNDKDCIDLGNRQCRVRLTVDQLDQSTVRLNNFVAKGIVIGRTVFVTQNPNLHCVWDSVRPTRQTCPCDMAPRYSDGDPQIPHATLAAGLADTGGIAGHDVLLVRAGSFPEAVTIDQPVTIRATRGVVVLGQ